MKQIYTIEIRLMIYNYLKQSAEPRYVEEISKDLNLSKREIYDAFRMLDKYSLLKSSPSLADMRKPRYSVTR